jgi:hypothetical protein
MDPGTAIGVASSCIAFFEFIIKFGRLLHKIREAGGKLPDDLQLCHRLMLGFERLLIRIHRDVQLALPTGPITESDHDLANLIEDCRMTGQELLGLLEDLSKQSKRGKAAWLRDLQKALRILRKSGRIKHTHQRLDMFRSELLLLTSERLMLTTGNME